MAAEAEALRVAAREGLKRRLEHFGMVEGFTVEPITRSGWSSSSASSSR